VIGFSGQTGARAVITLPPPAGAHIAPEQAYTLLLEAIDGAKWQAPGAAR
jgi:thiosulfate dehydrogenase (quinone)